MKLQTTGKSLEALAFALSLTGLVFCVFCMSGRSWEHGYGELPDIHRPTRAPRLHLVKPTEASVILNVENTPEPETLEPEIPEPEKPKPQRDVYFGPFDECGKHSTHTAECSKMYTCRLLLILAILHIAIPYVVERIPLAQNKCGMSKLKIMVGFNWIAGFILMTACLSLFDVFIRKDNSAFFREETDGHNFDDIVTWEHGAAYSFGWVGASLNLVAGAMYMLIGWKMY